MTQVDIASALELAKAILADRGSRWSSLEELVTAQHLFGLTTATPAQRLVCRTLDGLSVEDLVKQPVLHHAGEYPPEVRERCDWGWILGGANVADLPRLPPREHYLVGGIRTGKSLIEAAHSVHCARRVDTSSLRDGEICRYSGLSLDLDKASAILQHLLAPVTNRPALASHLIGEPVADGLSLRSQAGHEVQIRIVAGKRGGAGVVSWWSAGAVFDEAPRWAGAADAVVNFDESRAALLGRLLPGSQMLAWGSPLSPVGPIYQTVLDRHGKPGRDKVVLRFCAPALNPYYWSPERVEEVRNSEGGEQAYISDILGDFVDLESGLINHFAVERATRAEPYDLPYNDRLTYLAIIDPATRRNAWVLLILAKTDDDRVAVACCRQWQGTSAKPLSVDDTLREIADTLGRYRLDACLTDQWAADPLREAAFRFGVRLHEEQWQGHNRTQAFINMAKWLERGLLELAPEPALAADLRRVGKRVSARGDISIHLPQTPDGRHCDFAACLAMGLSQWIAPPAAPAPKPKTVQELEAEYKQRLKEEIRMRNEPADFGNSNWQRDLSGW